MLSIVYIKSRRSGSFGSFLETIKMPSLDNSLRRSRRASGFSQEALARAADISRQAYAAIESGRSVPSTEVALKLARVLETTVESLFSLASTTGRRTADLVGDNPDIPFPARVQLFTVGERLLARPLIGSQSTLHLIAAADGIAQGRSGGNRLSVEPLHPIEGGKQLVVAGGEPSITLLGRDLSRKGTDLVWLGLGSDAALRHLTDGSAHIAGCHLFDEPTGQYNLPWIDRLVPFRCTVITFAVRQQGLMVAHGNPRGIAGIDHLARPDLTFVNREPGSGSRALLDRLVSKAGILPGSINGYDRIAQGHLAVAGVVASGLADAGIGVKAAAETQGLDFVPLGEERYDLVVPDHFLHLSPVQSFIDILRLPAPRRQIEALGGYDVQPMGLPAT